ncbi:MAG: hypothetical protein HY329_28280 [Chloroflexi bacterium]|nr:hypothetical protein [Chloroflexota bacterium]
MAKSMWRLIAVVALLASTWVPAAVAPKSAEAQGCIRVFPPYGWFYEARVPLGFDACFDFFQESGTVAWVTVDVVPARLPTGEPLGAVISQTSWSVGPTLVGTGPTGFISPVTPLVRPGDPTGPGQFILRSVNVQSIAPASLPPGSQAGGYRVRIFYGAERGDVAGHGSWSMRRVWNDTVNNLPTSVFTSGVGQDTALTGRYDHTLYLDPMLGGNAALAGPQRDAYLPQVPAFPGAIPGDAGNSAATATTVRLGSNITIADGRYNFPDCNPTDPAPARTFVGERTGPYIDNRLGTDNPVAPDPADWYCFPVKAGAQVVLNAWPTRYDDYGGSIEFNFYRRIGSVLVLESTLTAQSPYEPVFSNVNPMQFKANAAGGVQDPSCVGYSPNRNTDPCSIPGIGPVDTEFYLQIEGRGFVRYSMTVDYLTNPVQANPGATPLPTAGGPTSTPLPDTMSPPVWIIR